MLKMGATYATITKNHKEASTMPTKRSVSQMKYDKANSRVYGLKLNRKTDADIIYCLSKKHNMQSYIKSLIRADIAANKGIPVKVLNAAGTEIDFDTAVSLMDDDLREWLHSFGYTNEQEFFTAYEKAHADKFGEEWELSKSNPVY